MARKLDGKVAIVTGGNSGIGEATAHLFAKEGASVAILARREAEGHKVEKDIKDTGAECVFISCDVGSSKSIDRAVKNIADTYGKIDILFNNAGGGDKDNFPNETDDGWEKVLNVNLSGTFHMCRAVWPFLIEAGGGAIVNMSSGQAAVDATRG